MGDTTMKSAIVDDESLHCRRYRKGDTVRCFDNGDECVVLGTKDGWLWLDPIDYRYAAPFTGRAFDYELVRRGELHNRPH